MAQGIVNRVVPSSAFALGVVRSIVHGTFLISSALHFVLSTRCTSHDDPATHGRDEVPAVELLRSTTDTFCNGDLENRDGVVAVVQHGRLLLTRYLNKDFVVCWCSFTRVFCEASDISITMKCWPCIVSLCWRSLLAATLFQSTAGWQEQKNERPYFAYAYPILLMQLLVAWTYFSSALIKLRVAGLKYLSADNLPALAIFHSLDNLHDTEFSSGFLVTAGQGVSYLSRLDLFSLGSCSFRSQSFAVAFAGGFSGWELSSISRHCFS